MVTEVRKMLKRLQQKQREVVESEIAYLNTTVSALQQATELGDWGIVRQVTDILDELADHLTDYDREAS